MFITPGIETVTPGVVTGDTTGVVIGATTGPIGIDNLIADFA